MYFSQIFFFLFRSILIVLFALCLAIGDATAAKENSAASTEPDTGIIEPVKQVENPTLAFFVPRLDAFWNSSVSYARAAAENLGVTLQIIDVGDNSAFMLKNVKQACKAGADGVIFPFMQGHQEALFQIVEDYRVPTILINAETQAVTFPPRSKYKHWVGRISHSYRDSGALLMERLHEAAKVRGVEEYRILAIEGAPGQEESKELRKGLEDYLRYNSDIFEVTILPGYWDPEQAVALFKEHYRTSPRTNIVWAANDSMALAVADAAKKVGVAPPLFIGGVGWSSQTMEALRERRMHVAVGSPFMEGAWAVLLLHDYLNGRDFAEEKINFSTAMSIATSKGSDALAYFLSLDPRTINFKRFSKIYNPSRKKYDFRVGEMANKLFLTGRKMYPTGLTPEEKEWLENHKNFRLGVDSSWPPLEFFDARGRYAGVASEYVRLLSKRLGVAMEPVEGLTWSEVLNRAKAGKLDVLPGVARSPERMKYLNFTRPYLSIPIVVVTRNDAPYVQNIAAIKDKPLAVVRGYAVTDNVRRDHPQLNLLILNEVEQVLEAVEDGQAFAGLSNLTAFSYFTQKIGLKNLKIAVTTPYAYELSFGVGKHLPKLTPILDKALATFTANEKAVILDKWINSPVERQIDWAYVKQVAALIVAATLLIIAMFVCWNRRLAKEVATRKKIEEKLRENKQFLENVVENIPIMLFVKDAQNLQFVHLNQAGEELLGYSRKELIGKSDYDFFTREDADYFTTKDQEVLRGGRLVDIPNEEIETRLHGRRTLHTKKIPILGKDGMPLYLLGISEDITEHKKAEEDLRKLTWAVEQSQASIVITDKDGAIEYVNPYFYKITGYTAEEALGRNPRVLKSGQHPDSFYREMWETLVAGKTWSREICNKKKNGTLFWEHVTISPLKDEHGHTTHYIAVKEDITEHKELQQLREDVDRIMRHDLKTPLNGIVGLPQLMMDDENLTSEQIEYLNLILEAGYRMLNQVNLSLDLYKMETGAYEFVPVHVDLYKVVDQILKDLDGKVKKKGVALKLGGESPCMAMAEELLSHTMFSNILANAIEASPDGGRVTVRIETGENVTIAVHNMGAVPEAIRNKFFEKYTTHGKVKGTGLGTYSAKLMAETQGGSIRMETSEKIGTTVTIRLPRG